MLLPVAMLVPAGQGREVTVAEVAPLWSDVQAAGLTRGFACNAATAYGPAGDDIPTYARPAEMIADRAMSTYRRDHKICEAVRPGGQSISEIGGKIFIGAVVVRAVD